jgi:hypothetical protein
VPEGQSWQARVAGAAAKEPGRQAAQRCEPGAGLSKPGAQGVQLPPSAASSGSSCPGAHAHCCACVAPVVWVVWGAAVAGGGGFCGQRVQLVPPAAGWNQPWAQGVHSVLPAGVDGCA